MTDLSYIETDTDPFSASGSLICALRFAPLLKFGRLAVVSSTWRFEPLLDFDYRRGFYPWF